jgi:hypothetical protein
MMTHGASKNVAVNGIMMARGAQAGVSHDVHDAFLTFIPGRIIAYWLIIAAQFVRIYGAQLIPAQRREGRVIESRGTGHAGHGR